jgi:hypothetical protein
MAVLEFPVVLRRSAPVPDGSVEPPEVLLISA